MIKIAFPKDFEKIRKLFPEKEKEKDLYIVCEESERSIVLGAIRFFYQKNQVEILEIVMCYHGEQQLEVFDGLIRTLLFRMAEEGCTEVVVNLPVKGFMEYFEGHGFKQEQNVLRHKGFPEEFFRPCGGCSA
ncbi:MAG: hypothetical protein ACRCU3_05110 [Eubacteriaceae bacterium]